MTIIRRLAAVFKSGLAYNRAARLALQRRDQEALEILAGYQGPSEYAAKAKLLSAVVLAQMRRYPEAVRSYSRFLSSHIGDIGHAPSRSYLQAYAIYYCDNALRNTGQPTPPMVSPDTLRSLAAQASYLVRHEFPPP